jgi:hypothetical protein
MSLLVKEWFYVLCPPRNTRKLTPTHMNASHTNPIRATRGPATPEEPSACLQKTLVQAVYACLFFFQSKSSLIKSVELYIAA